MGQFYYLCGKSIKVSEVKNLYLTNREYIYRPVYICNGDTMKNRLISKVYSFDSMEPYAAIVGEQEQNSLLDSIKTHSIKGVITSEAVKYAANAVSDYIDLGFVNNLTNRKKLLGINRAGREIQIETNKIPYLIKSLDGTIQEVLKNAISTYIRDLKTPAIQLVQCMVVEAGENYCFYGSGIDAEDIESEYNTLKTEIETQKSSVNNEDILLSNKESLEIRIKKIKSLFEQGLIPDEEYKRKLNELLAEI